jgi:hypothetical protein
VSSRTEYARLSTEVERPKRLVDHRDAWERLRPLLGVNGTARERVEAFARAKGITVDALVALGTRVNIDRNGGVELAWGYETRSGAVTAVKFRPLDDGKKRHALAPSSFLEPLVLGDRGSLDWFVAEGETDAARLYDLVGDVAAVLVLPAGAEAFKPAWSHVIPRGATVHLCHDADDAGDRGADKAARIIGGRTVRVRPPVDNHDWCDLAGVVGRDEFLELVRAARQGDEQPFALPLDEFVAATTETPPALIGDEQEALLPATGLLILFARGGKGKTTLTVDAVFHLAAGVEWLGFTVARPLRVLLIENEGPREPFRAKLELKRKLWTAEIPGEIHVATFDWGAVTLKNNTHVARLRDYIVDHEIDLVVGDPLDSLGLDGVGSPEDTREFMRRLGDTGMFRDVAWWLLAHARKESAGDELDEISGAWGGRPDTMLMLDKKDGNRARLSFPKIRWSRRGTRNAYILAFDPDTETFTVAHEEADEERDYVAEISELLSDGAWRTVREITAPKKDGGIGANRDTVQATLEGNPDRFVCRTGDDAKAVGRHPTSTVWQEVARPSEPPEPPPGSDREKAGGGSGGFPYKGSHVPEPPHPGAPELRLLAEPAEPAQDTGTPLSPEVEAEIARLVTEGKVSP